MQTTNNNNNGHSSKQNRSQFDLYRIAWKAQHTIIFHRCEPKKMCVQSLKKRNYIFCFLRWTKLKKKPKKSHRWHCVSHTHTRSLAAPFILIVPFFPLTVSGSVHLRVHAPLWWRLSVVTILNDKYPPFLEKLSHQHHRLRRCRPKTTESTKIVCVCVLPCTIEMRNLCLIVIISHK